MRKDLNGMRQKPALFRKKEESFPGRVNYKLKGPVQELGLICERTRKETRVSGVSEVVCNTSQESAEGIRKSTVKELCTQLRLNQLRGTLRVTWEVIKRPGTEQKHDLTYRFSRVLKHFLQ